MVTPAVLAAILAILAPAPVAAVPSPAAAVETAPNPQNVLVLIYARFRSHRPPPPFESYTLTRSQNTAGGLLDGNNSYTKHVWVRNSDRAALTRVVFGDGTRGPMTSDRPAFNEPRDPGPTTADMFESPNGDSDYRVDALEMQGDVLRLHISPVRNAAYNRLREVFADARTYELRKLVVVDTLFIPGTPSYPETFTYPVTFTITMGMVEGYPVITGAHGLVGGNYNDDGKEVDYRFTDIAFPRSLPDWYFDPRLYGQHGGDAPL